MQKAKLIFAAIVVLIVCTGGGAWALDEDAQALSYLPSDASMVMALDLDEIGSYAASVARSWRDADRAHFSQGLATLSELVTRKSGRPDVLTFLENLSGVQAMSMEPSGEVGMIVFSASSGRRAGLLRDYTGAYMVERRYEKAVEGIIQGLRDYRNRVEEDPETGEEVCPYDFPDSLDVLIEEGYLEAMPLNPYTGEPMRVLGPEDEQTLGDVAYLPRSHAGGCCGGLCAEEGASPEEETVACQSFELRSFRIGGVVIQGPWSREYEPYPDLSDRLRDLVTTHTWEDMGFAVQTDQGWEYFIRDDSEYAFASGESFLLLGKDVSALRECVKAAQEGGGYRFSTPQGFDTEGAFYRDEADLSIIASQMSRALGLEPPPAATEEGSISGTAYMDGRPVSGTVCLLNLGGDVLAMERTTMTGHYELRGLSPGQCRLRFLNVQGVPVGGEKLIEVQAQPGHLDLHFSSSADEQPEVESILVATESGAPEPPDMIRSLIEALGFEALSRQHTAAWLERGDIHYARRVELTGEAQRSLVGSMATAPPGELMTAEGGPFDLIGEMAWANPGDYAQALMDYVLEFVVPMAASEMGVEGVNPAEILSMMGLGGADFSELAEEAYVLLTSSEERRDGLYFPGIVGAIRTESEDLGPIAVGAFDTLSFMVPDFPLYMADFGDENAATWLMTNEECPISPTIAWCDGWVVKALWREDALRAREALMEGALLAPDGLDEANARVRFNRRALLRGLADIAYAIPEREVAPAGFFFEVLARLSGSDERLFAETISTDEYMETRCWFSLGVCENLMPAVAYIMEGAEAMGPF